MQQTVNSCAAILRLPAFWLFAFCLEAAAIFVLSVIPSVGNGINGGPAAHMIAYTTFSCTAGILLITKKIPQPIIRGALIAALFSGAIELVQYFIPFRACQFSDFAVNCIAALAGMAAAGAVQLVFFKKEPGADAAEV